jgi:hypothetical protein
MITFLSILFVLMVINGALLIFSVNGAMDGLKKTFKKISDNNVIKLPPSEFSETKYKKAV